MKNLKNLGRNLSKVEQKKISGGKLKGSTGGHFNDEPCVYYVFLSTGLTSCDSIVHTNCCPE